MDDETTSVQVVEAINELTELTQKFYTDTNSWLSAIFKELEQVRSDLERS